MAHFRSSAIASGLLLASAFAHGSAFANTSINATQLSVVVAPISISGTRLGGYVDATGNGLTAGAPPSVAVDGSLQQGATMTADLNTTFNFAVTARSGDQAVSAGSLAAALYPTTAFGLQTGKYSSGSGSLAIADTNAASVSAGAGEGVTATAIISTTMKSAENENQIRRIATSSNDQATFTAERQAARFQAGGSGLLAVTAGGLSTGGDTALGADPSQTALVGGGTQAGVAWTKSQEVRTGQAADTLAATSIDVTQPDYGVFTNTMGGTTAGAIGAAVGAIDMNDLTVAAGGAGTSSTLSVIQSLSAF